MLALLLGLILSHPGSPTSLILFLSLTLPVPLRGPFLVLCLSPAHLVSLLGPYFLLSLEYCWYWCHYYLRFRHSFVWGAAIHCSLYYSCYSWWPVSGIAFPLPLPAFRTPWSPAGGITCPFLWLLCSLSGSGPWSGPILSSCSAEVIKVEPNLLTLDFQCCWGDKIPLSFEHFDVHQVSSAVILAPLLSMAPLTCLMDLLGMAQARVDL